MVQISRRRLLALATAAGAIAAFPAKAFPSLEYTPELLDELKAGGRPFLIDFYATWCSTCAAQHRVVDALLIERPEFSAVPIVNVDWDQHERGPLVAELAIPRRSTWVLMRGNEELARLVAATGRDVFEDLFETALAG